MNSLKQTALIGLVWTATERFGIQIIQFVVSIILARMLLPEDFGMIGMMLVFVSIGVALRDSGMTNSLIRSKEPAESDYSTVFFMNLGISLFLYLIIYGCAPFIASFYERPLMGSLIRIQSLTIVIGAFSSIQYARLTKSMNFKKQLTIQLPSLILSALTGIGLAYIGYGVWSLVWMSVVQSLAASVQYWFLTKWRPKLLFSRAKLREHFQFGYKLTITSLVEAISGNILYLMIGKYFSPATLGFYTRAVSTKNLPMSNISGALYKVTYPLFAQIQDDDKRLKSVYRRLMQQVLFWVVPSLFSVIIVAVPLFRILFGEKWIPAAGYFQVLCVVGILYPLNSYNLNILTVKGRSDLYLKVKMINNSYNLVLLLAMLPFGIYPLLYMQIGVSIIDFFVNSHYAGRMIGYGVGEQLKDVFPIFLIGGMMLLGCFLLDIVLREYATSDLLRVVLVPLTGFALYFGLAKINNVPSFNEAYLILFKGKAKRKPVL